jgi:outer membrane protein assembly factor BamD
VLDEARKSAAVLGANFPGSDWYQRAYGLIQKKEAGVIPASAKQGRKTKKSKA